MKRSFAAVLLLAAAACGGTDEVSPEVLERRVAATRASCVAAELSRRAEEEYVTLQQSFAPGQDPAGEMLRRAAGAALEYARAYLQHAQLRSTRTAQVDSAFNFSPDDADSLRHVRAAEQLAIRVPEPGTVEANVYSAYQQDLANLLADADHPCNWDPATVNE